MTKECPHCKSQVRSDVNKCPVCIEWLNPWVKGGIYLQISIFLGAMAIPLLAFNYFTQNESDSNINSVKVVHSKKNQLGSELSIIGEIKNEGTETIQVRTIEAVFYDKDKSLINVADDYLGSDLLPGATRAFKIKFNCSEDKGPKTDFHDYKLNIYN